MASHLSPHPDAVSSPGPSQFSQDALPQEMLLPMLSGAQARGMADVFTLLGLPAIFLGADGCVLFANVQAKTLVGRGIDLRADHVVATNAADNERLSRFVAASLGAGPDTPEFSGPLALTPIKNRSGLTIRAFPLPTRTSSTQLLHAVLLLDTGDDDVVGAFLNRMAAEPSSAPQSRRAG